MRLLLINPRFPESFWSFRWAIDEILVGTRALNPPLGLATLAALCPPHWEVSIVDENVESIPLEPQTDLIGVCGMGVQFERQRALLAYYRKPRLFRRRRRQLCIALPGKVQDARPHRGRGRG